MTGGRKLATVALLLLLIAGAAAAHTADDRPHVQDAQEPRRVLTSLEDDGATLDLLLPEQPLQDALRLRFDTDTATLRYEHRREPARADDAYALEVRFREIVEFVDTNGNRRFDRGIDTVVHSRSIPSLQWRAPENRTTTLTTGDGDDARTVSGQTVSFEARTGDGGRLTVDLLALGESVENDALTLHPQDVSMGVHLDAWSYRKTDSRLAIVLDVWSPAATTVGAEHGTDRLLTGLNFHEPGANAGFLSWPEVTEVDGRDRVVDASVASRGTREGAGFVRALVINYPQAESVHHDFVLGLEYGVPAPPALLGLNPWFVALATGTALDLAAVGLYRSERRKWVRAVRLAHLAGREPPAPNRVVRAGDGLVLLGARLVARVRDRATRVSTRVRPSGREP